MCREAPSITNLLFDYDSLIHMKANLRNAETLKSILDLSCAASGQMVSVDKSSIFFQSKYESGHQGTNLLNLEHHDRGAQ